MRRGISALCLAAVVAGAAAGSGCVVHPRTAASVATAAIWTAAIAGHIAIVVHHDGHYHHETCGHYRRWHEERWVYYYEDRWEYYDDDAGVWYYYADDGY